MARVRVLFLYFLIAAAPGLPAAAAAAEASRSAAGPSTVEPATAVPPYAIGVVYWSMAIPGQVAMRRGLEREAARINRRDPRHALQVEGAVGGEGERGVRNQLSSMQRFIAARKDAIILQPIDSAALAKPVLAANRAGIPVVAYDQYVLEGKLACYVTSNNRLAGYLDGEYLAHRFRGRKAPLRLAIVEYPYVSSTIERLEGLRDALHNARLPYRIVGRYEAVEERTGRQVGKAIHRDLPPGSVDAVFCVNDGGGYGVMRELKAAGRRDLVMATVDGDPRMLEEIRRGELVGIDSAQFMGSLGAESMKWTHRKLKGERVPRQVLVTVFPITRDNLDAYPGWMGPIPASIRKPWPPYAPVPGNQLTW